LTPLLKAGIAAIALLCSAQAALAQPNTAGMVPPRRVTDARGVDLVGGSMAWPMPLVSFGEHATALSAWIDVGSPGGGGGGGGPVVNDFYQMAGVMVGAHILPAAYQLGSDGSPDEFGPFENYVFPTGAGFAQQFGQYPRGNPDQSLSIHTNSDGSRYTHSLGTNHFTRFQSNDPNLAGVYDAAGNKGIESPTYGFDGMVFANGEEWRFHRQSLTVPCAPLGNIVCDGPTATIYRLRFLTSSRGYGIQFLYQSDATPASNRVAGLWWAPRRVTAYNKAVTYCNESLLQECAAVTALPSAEISYDGTAHTATIRQPGATDGFELIFTQVYNNWIPLSYRHTAVPNSTVTIQATADNAGVSYISRVTDADGQWNYSHITYVDDSGHIPPMYASSINPAGGTVEIFGYGTFGTIQWYQDELNRPYYYSDGFPFRDWGRTEPEGDDTLIDRDERNNIVSITRYPKPNTGLSPLTLYTATFPVDCMNPRTCNRPITATDANNNSWSYTYAPEHGGVLTETGPLTPTRQSDGSMANVRPQKRYEYAQRYAWISNGSGGYMHGPTAIWLLTRERSCITTAASGPGCVGGAADEVVTDYDYGPDSGPNTLLLRGVAVTAYVSGAPVTQRTCYGYDSSGRRISETGPGAQLASCP
jgi:hypothetical protein